jgi:tRNA(Ile)-lysidine synthase
LVKNRADILLTAESNNTNHIFNIVVKDTLIQDPIQLFFSDENTFEKCDSKSVLLDKKKLKFPLILRKWKQSDYFYPYGMQGKKKLSKYFKDEKYSLLDKEAQWLLCSGEEIVWIIGKRADRRFLAHEKTQKKWLVRHEDI